jgi:hypothetical protein
MLCQSKFEMTISIGQYDEYHRSRQLGGRWALLDLDPWTRQRRMNCHVERLSNKSMNRRAYRVLYSIGTVALFLGNGVISSDILDDRLRKPLPPTWRRRSSERSLLPPESSIMMCPALTTGSPTAFSTSSILIVMLCRRARNYQMED